MDRAVAQETNPLFYGAAKLTPACRFYLPVLLDQSSMNSAIKLASSSGAGMALAIAGPWVRLS